MPETPTEAFDRGKVAGGVSVRLDDHDDQLAAIGKVLTKLTEVDARLTLAVQGLADEAKASRETAIALATALKDAKETAEGTARTEANKAATAAREAKTKDALGWSPVARVFAAVAALAIAFNLYQGLTGH